MSKESRDFFVYMESICQLRPSQLMTWYDNLYSIDIEYKDKIVGLIKLDVDKKRSKVVQL